MNDKMNLSSSKCKLRKEKVQRKVKCRLNLTHILNLSISAFVIGFTLRSAHIHIPFYYTIENTYKSVWVFSSTYIAVVYLLILFVNWENRVFIRASSIVLMTIGAIIAIKLYGTESVVVLTTVLIWVAYIIVTICIKKYNI